MKETKPNKFQKPPWLKRRLPTGPRYEQVRARLARNRLHTVCREACCPNIWECFSKNTATFMILGDRCTRSCRFCAVLYGPAEPPDPSEPERIALAVGDMHLAYVVVTSVTRDDLPDGGATHFSKTIRKVREKNPGVRVEVLIPDFQGSRTALHTVLEAHPDVLNHNLETVSRCYDRVRPEASYTRSLEIIERTSSYFPDIMTKSGLMLGIGETNEEIMQTLKDLRSVNCRLLTLGQYLQPSKNHLPVDRFITPSEFDHWRQEALGLGFRQVASGPFVRSSYRAEELIGQR